MRITMWLESTKDSFSLILFNFVSKQQTKEKQCLWQLWMEHFSVNLLETSSVWSHWLKKCKNYVLSASIAPRRLLSLKELWKAKKYNWLVEQKCTNLFAANASLNNSKPEAFRLSKLQKKERFPRLTIQRKNRLFR